MQGLNMKKLDIVDYTGVYIFHGGRWFLMMKMWTPKGSKIKTKKSMYEFLGKKIFLKRGGGRKVIFEKIYKPCQVLYPVKG